MDAPTVVSLAHATVGPATYPAGDGHLLTGLPPQKIVLSGRATLAGGETNVVLGFTPDPANQMVLCSYDFSQHPLVGQRMLSAGINPLTGT